MPTYDCIIVGGGFAGLSAAIYLRRYNRTTLVLDDATGRWNTKEVNENYLGFPRGISSRLLRTRAVKQAQRFGAPIIKAKATFIEKETNGYKVFANGQNYHSKTLLIATGVVDLFPHFSRWKEYVGKSLFWCITCDGYKTIDKRIVVVGHDNEVACTAMQFLNYTNQITFVTNRNHKDDEISSFWKKRLVAHMPFYESQITTVEGINGVFKSISLSDGKKIELDYMFSMQGAKPNTELFISLGVVVDRKGYILVDKFQRTAIPTIYAAGDVTKPLSHQIASAVYEGSAAAETINYDLYRPEQKES